MNEAVINEIQTQMNHERQNAQIYLFLASVCENWAYDGFAKFFRKQAEEEYGHAHKFEEFLISKRVTPNYRMLNGCVTPESLVDLASRVQDLERKTTEDLKTMYEVLDGVDAQACALLDWFLVEQIEEENWSADLFDLVSSTDSTGLLILDEKYGDM